VDSTNPAIGQPDPAIALGEDETGGGGAVAWQLRADGREGSPPAVGGGGDASGSAMRRMSGDKRGGRRAVTWGRPQTGLCVVV
jgi:hypothetical protein